MWIDKLERKFGRNSIKGLMKYVIGLYIIGFIIYEVNPAFYSQYLMLDIDKVLRGEVWRLITFVVQPIDSSPFLMLLACYVYYSVGTSLEHIWGSFRFNLYYFSGIIFTMLSVVVIYIFTYFYYGIGISIPVSLSYLNSSLFLALALAVPDLQIMLMFLIPIKGKYFVIGYFVFQGYQIFENFYKLGSFYGIVSLVQISFALANFFIFFFALNKKTVSNIKRKVEFRHDFNTGAREARRNTPFDGTKKTTRHKCTICGRTELDDENLEFRFCSKCNGNHEYCQDHLFTHEHIK